MVVPTQLKVLRGNPGRKPIRPEPLPSLPAEEPEPPEFLLEEGKTEWRRIVRELYRLRLLTTLDVNTLAAYCQAYARWFIAERALAEAMKNDPKHGGLLVDTEKSVAVNPLIRIASAAAREMVEYAGQFGLSPRARSRIAAGLYPVEPKSKFEGLIGGKGKE